LNAAPSTLRSPRRRVLEDGIDLLRRSGVSLPRYSAEVLLSAALSLSRARIYLPDPDPLSPGEKDEFYRLLSLRSDRFPLSYLTGTAGFYSLEFRSDRRALIPRPETEVLVEESLSLLEAFSSVPARILDLGCGGGAIALALAAETGSNIFASDISRPALDLARENARRLGLAGRVTFRRGDLFSPWRDATSRGFDLIVSNPPYISDPELDLLPDEVRLHEPETALRGGADGLDIIRRLIAESPEYLKPGGFLVFEIGAGQGDAVRRLLRESPALKSVVFRRDYQGRERVAVSRSTDPEALRGFGGPDRSRSLNQE
jgi:release factor glutamine methyltransferase